MKKLYLVRHGETLFNQKYLIQGTCDSALTPLGHAQAKEVKEYFEQNHITFDHAYCSMMHRTEETLLDITSTPYERRSELNERNYGSLEGESRKIAEHLDWQAKSKLYEYCGGEKEEHLIQRMKDFMFEILNKEDHQSVICVSHGAAISYFMFHIDADFNIHRLKNCHVLELEYDGNYHFVNDFAPKNG